MAQNRKHQRSSAKSAGNFLSEMPVFFENAKQVLKTKNEAFKSIFKKTETGFF